MSVREAEPCSDQSPTIRSRRPAESADARFIASLESLRGLAALTVCLFHAGAIRLPSAPDSYLVEKQSLAGMLFHGHGAVILFFVLSGFVLRLSLAAKPPVDHRKLAFDFVASRLFRLFPVVFIVVAIYAIAVWISTGSLPQADFLLRNAFLVEASIAGQFWTLQAELFGSLIVLAAFLLEKRFGLIAPVLLCAALLPLSFIGQAGMLTSLTHSGLLYTFLLGYLAAALSPRLGRRQAASLLCLALISFYGVHMFGSVFAQWGLLATALSATIIIVVMAGGHFAEWLEAPLLRSLGAIAYSLYAIHVFAIDWAQIHAGSIEAVVPQPMVTLVLLTSIAGISLLLALALHSAVEKPGIRLGRWLRRSLS